MAQTKYSLIIGDIDNPLISDLENILKRQNIYFLFAESAAEMMKTLKEKEIDFIFVAPFSLRQDTLDFLGQMKLEPSLKKLPSIIFSPYYLSPSIAKATKQLKNSRYMIWPVSTWQLLETMNELRYPAQFPKKSVEIINENPSGIFQIV